jgi:hypothetical protein
MSDLLKNLFQGAKSGQYCVIKMGHYKWYQSYYLAWDGGSVYKPKRVASGYSLGRQELGDLMRVASEDDAGSQERVIVTSYIAWVWEWVWVCAYIYIYIFTSFLIQRILKPWTYQNSAVKRVNARVMPRWMTSWEIWFGGAKTEQYCVVMVGRYKWYQNYCIAWDGGSMHMPIRVTSGHSLERQELRDLIRVASRNVGS